MGAGIAGLSGIFTLILLVVSIVWLVLPFIILSWKSASKRQMDEIIRQLDGINRRLDGTGVDLDTQPTETLSYENKTRKRKKSGYGLP